ncbi:MAG: response regulator transcription factor [Bacteroidetes bacterium]|nr:response regulator transcription factor [Bacteroidota bacterium]
MKILLVDDEESARKSMRNKLARYNGQVRSIDEADGVQSALLQINNQDYDLIFLDIQMPDGTGFDLLEKMGDHTSMVAFTTAYDDFALKAFEFAAIGYLLKPVDTDKLDMVMQHAGQLRSNRSSQYKLLVDSYREKKIRKLVIPNSEGFLITELSDILFIQSDVNYSVFHFVQSPKTLVSSKTLKEYTQILEPEGFFRVHQSYLINLSYAREYKKNYSEVVLTDGTHVPVARQKKMAFQALFA